MTRKKAIVWGAVLVCAAAVGLAIRHAARSSRLTTLEGAVIRQDDDPRRRTPIAGAEVTASAGAITATTHTDSSGYFRLRLPRVPWPGQHIILSFSHADFRPGSIDVQFGIPQTDRRLFVEEMTPLREPPVSEAHASGTVVSNVRVRYTENDESERNVGSAVKTFEVNNVANTPCLHTRPCSPNGAWKATAASVTLDAGSGNHFRNMRASCIAGPCPFTRIDTSGMVDGSRIITVSATDWSDPATFLLEAEVYHRAIESNVRRLYPVVYGRALHFTLPPTEEGVSIEADVDGASMVFPLGPNLNLSWATCSVRGNQGSDRSTIYLCELKPGYRF